MKSKMKKKTTAKALISQAQKAGIRISMTTEGVVEIDSGSSTDAELVKTLKARKEDLESEIVDCGLHRLLDLTIERLEAAGSF